MLLFNQSSLKASGVMFKHYPMRFSIVFGID